MSKACGASFWESFVLRARRCFHGASTVPANGEGLASSNLLTRPISGSRVPVSGFSASTILDEGSFSAALHVELRRAERSRCSFILMILDCHSLIAAGVNQQTIETLYRMLTDSTRETDITGWHKGGSAIGVIFTEIDAGQERLVADVLLAKMKTALSVTLASEQAGQINLSCHIFPEDGDQFGDARVAVQTYTRTVSEAAAQKRLLA